MGMLLVLVYTVLIVAVSLLGGWIPRWIEPTHRRMEFAVSFVAGVILGVAMLHMLPHAVLALPRPMELGWAALAGLLCMFFVERFFCFHHHDPPEALVAAERSVGGQLDRLPQQAPTAPGAHFPHHACSAEAHGRSGALHGHELTWTGAFVGLTLHSLVDGFALAASIEVDRHAASNWPAGLGMFLVVFLHKPFDSLTLGTLMAARGFSRPWRNVVNIAFAMVVLLGMGIFYLLYLGMQRPATDVQGGTSAIVGYSLAFAAGALLCVSLSDLLPELQFHQHDRWKLSLALLLGLAVAAAVAWAEGHVHDHQGSPPVQLPDGSPS
jgi:zinc and cadmium transporter